MPVFHNFDYVQERNRFYTISKVQKAFREPIKPAIRKTFRSKIKDLGETEYLNLEVEADPT